MLVGVLLVGLAVFGSYGPSRAELRRSWPSMGTYAEVVLDAPEDTAARRAVRSVRRVFARVNRTMSVYDPDSDLSRVNRWAGMRSVMVDPWVVDAVRRGRRGAIVTGGAFSLNVLGPGVASGLKPPFVPASRAWVPDAWIRARMFPPTVYLPRSEMALDAGGIAKGFALDRAAERLRRRGFARFFLSLGRSVYAGAPPRDREGWPVRIAGEEDILAIRDQSIAVSRQGLRSDTGHILDPRSGRPVPARRQVVVHARRGWVADLASTALYVRPALRERLREHYPSLLQIRVRTLPAEAPPP